ncbi:efflux RND transporter periplasmic adaptor subunit [Rhodobacteraceae bacterium F11138]|nr:efflux RND transporter periplasmic adaptor subunit [Rhodobacteraceae bacterium F11138]
MRLFQKSTAFGAALGLVAAIMVSPVAAQEEAVAPKVSIAAAYTEEITDEAVMIAKGEAINEVDIVARVSGFVEEILVEDGAEVSEGDLLFRIERDNYEATLEARRADLGQAEANLELARIELSRKAKLLERGSAPEAERDIARANELSAEASVKSAKSAIRQAELELSYTEIRAPFDGRIGRASVSVGELVGPGTPPLVSLVRQSPIYVRFSMSEKQLTDVMEALDTTMSELTGSEKSPDVFAILPNGSELDEPGRIVFLDNRISPTTGTIALLAKFQNTRQLILDGAFLHVRITALEPTLSLLVPQASVQRDQRGDFVLVVNAQQMVEQRYIQTGKPIGTAITVTEGLQEGESVIVEGLQRVRPGVQVDAILSGQQEGN